MVLRSNGSSKSPSPLVVHSPSDADPPMLPETLTVSPAHMVWSDPVLATGASIKDNVIKLGVEATGHPAASVIDTIDTVAVMPIAKVGTVSIPVAGSNDGKRPSRHTWMEYPLGIGRSSMANGGNTDAVMTISASKGASPLMISNRISVGLSGQFPAQTSPPPERMSSGQLISKP